MSVPAELCFSTGIQSPARFVCAGRVFVRTRAEATEPCVDAGRGRAWQGWIVIVHEHGDPGIPVADRSSFTAAADSGRQGASRMIIAASIEISSREVGIVQLEPLNTNASARPGLGGGEYFC